LCSRRRGLGDRGRRIGPARMDLPADGASDIPEPSRIFRNLLGCSIQRQNPDRGGGDLPLTAAGKAAYDKNIAGLKDGSIADNARKYCVPDGLPRLLANPYPFEIIQAPRARSPSCTSSAIRSARSRWTSRCRATRS